MFCTNCGSNITDDEVFCTNCGQAVQAGENVNAAPVMAAPVQPPAPAPEEHVFCTNCGSRITKDEVFCTNCGQAVEAGENVNAAPVMTAPVQPSAPVQENYVFCTNCGEKIEEDALFCTKCGAKVGTDSFEPQRILQPNSMPKRKKVPLAAILAAAGVAVVLVIIIIVVSLNNQPYYPSYSSGTGTVSPPPSASAPPSSGTATAPAPSAPAQSTGGTATAPALSPPPPPPPPPPAPVELRPRSQIQFENVILNYSQEFNRANNELQESVLRKNRINAIAALNMGFYVENWVGTVDNFGTNTEGKAYIKIRLSPYLSVETTNNAFSDALGGFNSLIEMDSGLYQVIYNLNKGQRVRFSGNLFRSDDDFYNETSMTIRGAMTDSEFIMRFTDIEPF